LMPFLFMISLKFSHSSLTPSSRLVINSSFHRSFLFVFSSPRTSWKDCATTDGRYTVINSSFPRSLLFVFSSPRTS
jgi:hypothetical protein